MRDHFVTQLQHRGGAALYCDSCHHGTTIFLDRSVPAKPDLARYMNEEYVQQLRRRDGQAHGCATCHGNPINPMVPSEGGRARRPPWSGGGDRPAVVSGP